MTRQSIPALLRTLRIRIGPAVRHLDSALRKGLWTKTFRAPPEGEEVRVRRSDGFELAGRLYRPPPDAPSGTGAPGLLMLHGWDPQGQGHGLYLALAEAMTRRGYVVLTLNLRGYPGSHAPAEPSGFSLDELTSDALAAVDFLADHEGVDERRLALLGHSYGAGLVIPVLARRPMIARAVIYGPSIWMVETTTGPHATHREFYHERYWRYMDGVKPIPMADFLRLAEDIYIPAQLDELEAGHAPILLLDGADEPDTALEFSALLLDLLLPPREYWSIPGTDHFCNTALIGKVLVEDRTAIAALAGKLDDWSGWGVAGATDARSADMPATKAARSG